MKTRNLKKKLTLNKKTIADLTLNGMRKLHGGIPPVTTQCNTLFTEYCCTVHTYCSPYYNTCMCTGETCDHCAGTSGAGIQLCPIPNEDPGTELC